MKLSIRAPDDVVAFTGPFKLWIAPKDDPTQKRWCTFTIKGATTDAGDLLVNETDTAWLTVVPKS